MKRLLLISIVALLTIAVSAQGLFSPVPKTLFTTEKAIKVGEVSSAWLPRINVGLNAISYGKNAETGQLEVTPLNAIAFGLGYLHYKNVAGVPFNDFGFNVAYLQLIDKAGSGVGLYGTYNTGQIGLLNIGAHYDFAVNQIFVDTGVTWHF